MWGEITWIMTTTFHKNFRIWKSTSLSTRRRKGQPQDYLHFIRGFVRFQKTLNYFLETLNYKKRGKFWGENDIIPKNEKRLPHEDLKLEVERQKEPSFLDIKSPLCKCFFPYEFEKQNNYIYSFFNNYTPLFPPTHK